MATVIDTYLASPTLSPESALVTGYDFLIDQAEAIQDTLSAQGVGEIATLIDNAWTAEDFRTAALGSESYDLISLNSHFDHFRFFPNDPDNVLATEFDIEGNFEGALVFSVGCHAGLNMPDGQTALIFTGADFAQVFSRHGAAYVGNTGYGYGDGDLLAYSERLALNFTAELGYNPTPYQTQTLTTVGYALLRARHRYLHSRGDGGLPTYDEKVLAEMPRYGLPMLKVAMPVQSDVVPGGDRLFNSDNPPLPISGPDGA